MVVFRVMFNSFRDRNTFWVMGNVSTSNFAASLSVINIFRPLIFEWRNLYNIRKLNMTKSVIPIQINLMATFDCRRRYFIVVVVAEQLSSLLLLRVCYVSYFFFYFAVNIYVCSFIIPKVLSLEVLCVLFVVGCLQCCATMLSLVLHVYRRWTTVVTINVNVVDVVEMVARWWSR